MELSKIVTSDPNKVTTLGFQGFRLQTVSEAGVRSALSWACRDGYPRAVLVFDTKIFNQETNHDNYVSYPIDAIRLITALEEWAKILRSKKDGKFSIVVMYDGKFIGKLGLVLSNGKPSIVATQDSTKQVVFRFTAKSPYVDFERDGQPANLDIEMALSYVECLKDEVKAAVGMFMTSSVKDREVRQQGYRRNIQPQPTPQPQVTQPVQQPVAQQPVQQPQPQVQQQPTQQQVANVTEGDALEI